MWGSDKSRQQPYTTGKRALVRSCGPLLSQCLHSRSCCICVADLFETYFNFWLVVYFGVLRCGDVFLNHQKTKSNLPSRVRFFLIFFWGGFEIYPDLRFVHTTIFIRIWDLTIRFYPELNLISCLVIVLVLVHCFLFSEGRIFGYIRAKIEKKDSFSTNLANKLDISLDYPTIEASGLLSVQLRIWISDCNNLH